MTIIEIYILDAIHVGVLIIVNYLNRQKTNCIVSLSWNSRQLALVDRTSKQLFVFLWSEISAVQINLKAFEKAVIFLEISSTPFLLVVRNTESRQALPAA
jgi:hypothetical protein